MGIIPKDVFLFITLLLTPFTACTQESATVSIPTAIVLSTERPTSITPIKISSPLPEESDAIHLRIEFQTSSDWSDLSILIS